MKLIIDIPENVYNACNAYKDNILIGILQRILYTTVSNGIPLEELKKDIEEIDIKENVYKLPDLKCCGKRDKSAEEIKEQILERIDKYIKEAL